MVDFNKMSSFTLLAEIFNRRTAYEEMVHEGGFSIPKKNRRDLNGEIAQWTIDNIKNFNSGNPRLQEMINTCKEYLAIEELINRSSTAQT